MTRVNRAVAVLGIVVLSASVLTACTAPGTTAGDTALLAARERAATDVDAQLEELGRTESALDLLLVAQSGLAEAAGADPATVLDRLRSAAPAPAPDPVATDAATGETGDGGPAAASVKRHRAAPRAAAASMHRVPTAPAQAQAPQPASPSTPSRTGSASPPDTIRDSLGAAAQDDDSVASFDSAEGANPAIGWTVEKGAASGTITSTIADTGPDGTRFEMLTEGEYHLLVCPAGDGSIEGGIWVRSAITVTPPGGAPQRSVIELNIDLGGTVNDEAYAADSFADGTATLSQGAPGSGPADLATGASTQKTTVESTFAYEQGSKEVRDIALSDAEDTDLTSIADDLSLQMHQVLLRMAEDYWRSSNCVRAVVTADRYALGLGESTGIQVAAEVIADGSVITEGESEWTGVVGVEGVVTPTEAQKLPGSFVFEAGNEKGEANPEFKVTTRRGIGVRVAPIEVGGSGWSFTGTYGGGIYRGYSCTDIRGPWLLSVSVPEINESWTTTMTFDDALSSGYDDAGTGPGPWADPDARYWFTPEGGGYVFHADPYDPSFPVSEGAVEECSG